MDNISDKDKLGMAALAASVASAPKKKFPLPKPRPKQAAPALKKRKMPTAEDVAKGRISIGDANDMAGYKSGGMIDRAAIKGKTRGKIC